MCLHMTSTSLSLFSFSCYSDHRDLHVLTHSFPTRRSSDLVEQRRCLLVGEFPFAEEIQHGAKHRRCFLLSYRIGSEGVGDGINGLQSQHDYSPYGSI